MATQIIETRNRLRIVTDGAVTGDFIKRNIRDIVATGGTISVAVDDRDKTTMLPIPYNNISYPPSSSVTDLRNTIIEMIEEGDDGEPRKVDQVGDTLIYIGYAQDGVNDSDAAWMIKKIETIGTVTSITWAISYRYRINIWSDRASLVYV